MRLLKGDKARRNAVMEALAAANIQTRPGTHAVHRLGYYATKYGIRPEAYPNACDGEDLTITLPLFPGMSDQQQSEVVDTLKQAIAA